MTTILQHEDGSSYRPDQVSVQYDGRVRSLEVDENGSVKADNKAQVEALKEHDGFFLVDDMAENSYVLYNKSVNEIEEYLSSITSVDRLKELREKEGNGKNRKTALNAVDDRIEQVKSYDETGE